MPAASSACAAAGRQASGVCPPTNATDRGGDVHARQAAQRQCSGCMRAPPAPLAMVAHPPLGVILLCTPTQARPWDSHRDGSSPAGEGRPSERGTEPLSTSIAKSGGGAQGGYVEPTCSSLGLPAAAAGRRTDSRNGWKTQAVLVRRLLPPAAACRVGTTTTGWRCPGLLDRTCRSSLSALPARPPPHRTCRVLIGRHHEAQALQVGYRQAGGAAVHQATALALLRARGGWVGQWAGRCGQAEGRQQHAAAHPLHPSFLPAIIPLVNAFPFHTCQQQRVIKHSEN